MDTLAIVNDRIRELQTLYSRMDSTRNRVYNTAYKLKGVDGKDLDNVISVTMPYAAIFANTVINDLMDAVRQTVVDGAISDRQKHTIENFIDDNRTQADEQLRRKGFPSLFAWWCNHVCIRSFIGVRWVSQIVDGKFVIDCLPVDMRYCSWEYGNDGLNWVCNTTYRSASQIKSEYDIDLSGTDIEVKDFWSSEKNEVYVAEKKAIDQKNPFGSPPFVIGAPATGFMLRDKGYLEHESEDLLFLIRGLYDEINRSVSIEQTVGMEAIRPRYQDIVEEMDSKPATQPPKTGQTVKRKKGLELQLAPVRDLNNAFLTGRVDLQKALQMGGVNEIDLGNVSQTVSAVWITAQTGIRKKFSNPRLKCIAECEQQLARMMITQNQQLTNNGGSPEIVIGGTGRKRKYSPGQLGDPEKYSIKFELMSQSKTEEIANLAQFEAAGNLPMRWKLTNILKADDPDGIMRELEVEEARRADPAIALFEMALRYVEEAEQIEDEDEANAKLIQAKMLAERGVAIIKQRNQPVQPLLPEKARVPQAEPIKGNAQALMPLLGGGGGGGVARRQPQPEEVAGG